MVVSDALIELANGTTGTPANDAGLVIERGDSNNAFIGFDESADKFIVGTGSFTGASTGDLTITTGTLVANVEGNVTGNVTGSSGSTTGNAATATALETARTIGGVSFNGTANINLPGVNTSGNQDTSGNAATATALATGRTISLTGAVTGTSAAFDGSGNVSIATTATSDPTITLTGAVTGSGTMTNLGNVSIATTATADPTLTLSGDASGSATFTNLGNATLSVTVADDSHNHVISNVDGLQTALDGKYSTSGGTISGNVTINGTLSLGAYTINDVEDIYLRDKLFHDGDTDTYLGFGTDTINLVAAGTTIATLNTSGIFMGEGSLHEDWDGLSGTTPTVDTDGAGAFSLTMTGNTTFTFGGTTSGYSSGFILQLTGNGGTVTWPASVDWAGGTAPDAPASGETDLLVFWTRDGGTTWYGMLAIDAAA